MNFEINSNARLFLYFIVSIVAAIFIASAIFAYFVIEHSLEKTYQSFVNEKIIVIQGSIDRFVSVRTSSLQGHARLPIIVSSVMQLDQDLSRLHDHMEDLTLLGRPASFALLNIDGEVIQSTSNYQGSSFIALPWIDGLIEERLPSHTEFEIIDGEFFIAYAVPVKYRDFPEGILLARSRVSESGFLDFLGHTDDSIAMDIIRNGEIEKSLGNALLSDYVQSEKYFEALDTTIRMRVEVRGLQGAVYEMLSLLLLALLLTGLAGIAFFRLLGERLFVEPARLLEFARRDAAVANERLEYANEELRQFAYRTSHDIKAPLITIQGLSSIVIQDLEDGDSEEVETNVIRIKDQAGRLEKLVNDILDLSRADLSDSELELIDFAELVARIKLNLSHSISTDKVDVIVNVESDCKLYSQQTRIAQILENLISNGIKYRNRELQSSYVKVDIVCQREAVLVKVEDNGIGIPENCKKDVFAMFKRFHPGVSVGTGLGMSLVKKHVEKLGAEISFESDKDGTRFDIVFPQLSRTD